MTTHVRYPLSCGQLGALRSLLSRPDMTDPRAHGANLSFVVDTGPAKPTDVRRVLHALESRHASLRCVLDEVRSEQPGQWILPARSVEPEVIAAEQSNWDEVAAAAHEATCIPVEGDVLWRAVLLHDRATHRTGIGISISHVIADEWAIQIIRNEIAALLRGDDLAAAPQIHEVALRERERLPGRTDRAIARWAAVIDGSDLATPEYDTVTRYASVSHPLTAEHLRQIRERRTSPAAAVVHAYGQLLDGPQALCLVAGNRFTREDRGLIASMVQPAVLRIDPDDDLASTTAECLRAFACARFDPDTLDRTLPAPLTATGGGFGHMLNMHFADMHLQHAEEGTEVSTWEVPVPHAYPSYVRAIADETQVRVVWGVSASGARPRPFELLNRFDIVLGVRS